MALAAAAGYLDAIGHVYLGGFFVSFMSGNSTELATGVAGGQWQVVRLAATLIGCFFLGAVLGALLTRVGDGRTTVLTTTTALVGSTALLAGVVTASWPVTLLLPLAMGVVNATFLIAGETSIGLTYMTGALVKAGQRLADAFRGGPRWLWLRHLSLWLALVTGGVAGAVMLGWVGLSGALWPIVAALAVTTAVTAVIRRRRGGGPDTGAPAATHRSPRETEVLRRGG